MVGERSALTEFFRRLDRGGMIALGPNPLREDEADGHEEVRLAARDRGVVNPDWVFWTRRSAWVFDQNGDLNSGLRINWGTDHGRVRCALSDLPEPFRLVDHGPGAAFEIVSDALVARSAEPLPEPADTVAVKARIRRITAPVDRRAPESWSTAEKEWMRAVLIHGDVAARGAVVAWIIRWDGLDAEALDALLADWVKIYAKAPSWALTADLLRLLHRRGDPRLDEVLAISEKSRNRCIRGGLAHFLAERRRPDDVERLYRLAQQPSKDGRTAGDATALRCWLDACAARDGGRAADAAERALEDPVFDEGARAELRRLASY